MQHFLAYGNSDQASFRRPDVRAAFQYLTVPGTIAAYYPDATAAFVLSLNKKYVIDPRTPLFQGSIVVPKASHFSLAEYHGSAVRAVLGSEDARQSVVFLPRMYSPEVIREMVTKVIAFQANYPRRADRITEKIDRYRRLRQEATGVVEHEEGLGAPAPSFILAPYFCTAGEDDDWWMRNLRIWEACCAHPRAAEISPVIAVQDVRLLATAVHAVPFGLRDALFYWVAGFNEREASRSDLSALAESLQALAPNRQLVNLYGGYFSICMRKVGLWGFSNGLTYSEARDWPELSATGAALPRYYIRELHAFLPQATAQAVVEIEPAFACSCPVCTADPVADIDYHGLKRHFALARGWEMDRVTTASSAELAQDLIVARDRYVRIVRPNLPPLVRGLDIGYLERWATVVADL